MSPPEETPSRTEVRYSPEELREALAHVPTPVTVITALDAERRPHGTTVSAFASLSASPPLVLAALDCKSNLLALLRDGSRFGVNVLSVGQEEIAIRCASKDPDKFDDVPWEEVDGTPRIVGCSSWFLCDIEAMQTGGDHEIVVGHVYECALEPNAPLVYHRRAFTLPGEAPDA